MPNLDANTRQIVIAKVLELPLSAWSAEFHESGFFMHFVAHTAKGSSVVVSAEKGWSGRDYPSSPDTHHLHVDGEYVDGDTTDNAYLLFFTKKGPITTLYEWLYRALDVERRSRQVREERQQHEQREGRKRMLNKF